MNIDSVMLVFESIGSVVGVLVTCATFWGLISKKPKQMVKNFVRKQVEEVVKPTNDTIQEILQQLDANKTTSLAILRDSITQIYQKYKDEECLPVHMKENLYSLYERYVKLGGNSYIVAIVEEMNSWDCK